MRILVTGATGQLGREIVGKCLQHGHEVIGPGRQELDFLFPDQVADRVREIQAHWVVNCAAYTQVDRAESEPQEAHTVNRDSAGRLAGAVAAYGGRLLHVSTDYVFDGRQSTPYTEEDTPNPLSVYGHSKWAGEQAVHAALPEATVLRSAWVYGVHGHNFVKTMLKAAAQGKPLRVVDDQTGSPTWSADIATAVTALIEKDTRGLFHFSSAGSTTWHGFATAILFEAAQLGFDVRTATVEPIPTSAFPTPAVRPANSVLDTRKIRPYLSAPIPLWRESLINMLEELHSCAE